MSQRITIEIKDKIATCLTESPVVCGNADYIVDFVFDEEWEKHEVKTAMFVVNGKAIPQVFVGNACPVPVIQNTLIAWVGVFAGTVDDGTLSTSTPALVKCVPCVTDGDNVPMAPPDDVYNQIIALLDKYIDQGGGTDEERVREIAEGVVDDKIAAEIPAWAKEPTKPSYTAEEVGALPSDTPLFSGDYNDLSNKPEGLASEEYVNQKADVLSTEITAINTVLEQSGIVVKYKSTIEDTYNERITADGLNVLDGSLAKLEKVVGSTVKCNNLIPFPYRAETSTNNGVTFTSNADGSIIVNGQNNGNGNSSYPLLASGVQMVLKAGIPYTLSIECDSQDVNVTLYANGVYYSAFNDTSKSITVTQDTAISSLYVQVNKGNTANLVNKVVLVMLNEGETALPYQPYFEGLKNASFAGIESTGRNLIPFPYTDGGVGSVRTTNGITFTVNADGSITAKGTATGVTFFNLCKVNFGDTLVTNGTANGLYFKDCTYNPSNNTTYIRVNTGETVDKTYYPMINRGTTALPYKPYIEPSVFNFPKTELGEWDEIDFEKQKVVKGTETITLDGSKAWMTSETDDVKGWYVKPENWSARGYYGKDGYISSKYISGALSGNNFVQVFPLGTTLEEVRAYFDGIVVAGKLKQPTETPFTEGQSARGNEYRAYSGGTERVLGNDNAEFGAKNTLSQNYIIVTGVK